MSYYKGSPRPCPDFRREKRAFLLALPLNGLLSLHLPINRGFALSDQQFIGLGKMIATGKTATGQR